MRATPPDHFWDFMEDGDFAKFSERERAMARKADPFSVWGQPPDALSKDLTQRQMNLLRKFVQAVAESTYRLAYDNGFVEGLCNVSSFADKELKKRRDCMARS